MYPTPSSTSLTITNPLVKYRALLATRNIRPDPAQHRLALQLQNLYYRLKDYNPELEYRHRLDQITRTAGIGSQPCSPSITPFSSIWRGRSSKGVLALIRTATIQESALSINSPQGMLLYGEVGRGKSMLLDLFADSLPSGKKKRWHFNTFILDTFHRLEQLRMQRYRVPPDLQEFEHEHSVLTLAKDTIATSPILFLDEFQLPDRAASKLLNSFLTSFFHLGGVLIASSNRMPDELANAAGIEYAPRPSGRNSVLKSAGKRTAAEKAATTDFGAFLDLLKARCEIWEMEGDRDWRRDDDVEDHDEVDLEEGYPATVFVESEPTSPDDKSPEKYKSSSTYPQQYHVASLSSSTASSANAEMDWNSKICSLVAGSPSFAAQAWAPATLSVYARQVFVPAATSTGYTLWSFSDLCATNLGPADYVSLASTYHTLILDSVPVLHLVQKNEARRFITLLDALYEARCRLLIRAAAPPDHIFFPEIQSAQDNQPEDVNRGGDQVYQETLAEIYQDSTSPFRPNISSYAQQQNDSSATPTRPLLSPTLRSVLADEDADFGPVYGNGRGQAAGPHGNHINTTQDLQQQKQTAEPRGPTGPDFTKTAALTGEDERFAFKRARSRIWEMCGQRWWKQRPSDQVEQWWRPVAVESRFWEQKKPSSHSSAGDEMTLTSSDPVATGQSSRGGTRDSGNGDGMFKHGATSPFRTRSDPPPKFGWQHAWGMVSWGRKAGEWGKGVDGVRRKD